MKRFWRELKTTDFDGDTSNWVAVLPVAAIEQHGPHLPLGVDAMIAEGMISHCAATLPEASPAVFLPVQEVGKSTEHQNFSGTLSLNWTTTVKVWLDIGESLAKSGIRKMLIITSHGGNTASMDTVARQLRARFGMLVVLTSWEKLGPQTEKNDAYIDIHGGEFETSIMLALNPDQVDMSKAENFDSGQSDMKKNFKHLGYHSSTANISWLAEDLNPAGTVGNASAATADKGNKIIEQTVINFVELIDEIDRCPPPANIDS